MLTMIPPIPLSMEELSAERPEEVEEKEIVDPVDSYLPLTLFTLAISTGGLIFGYDIGTIGAIIDMPSFVVKFGDNTSTNPTSFNGFTKGALIGISSLGGCLGGLCTTQLIPFAGPRVAIFVAAVCSCIGNIIIIISDWWIEVLVGRVFYGTACGMICVACPMLISELVPTRKRGLFISLLQLHITIGIISGAVTMFLCDWIFGNDATNTLQYGYPLLQGIGLSIFTCSVIFIVPESPTWIVSKGRDIAQAKESVARTRNLEITDPSVIYHVQSLITLIGIEDENEGELLNKLHRSLRKGQPRYLLRVVTGIILSCLQQFTGINYFFFFGTAIFRTVGVRNPYLVPIFFGLVNVVFSIISVPVIGSYNRINLLLIGSTLLGIMMFIFSTVGLFASSTEAGSVIMIMASCGFIAAFATTWGPLVSIVVSELYPPIVKVKAMAICGCMGWIATFIVSFLIPPLTNVMGFGLGYIFFCFAVLSVGFVYRFVPETRHREIRELDEMYEDGEYWKR